jgi:hypothetical protein
MARTLEQRLTWLQTSSSASQTSRTSSPLIWALARSRLPVLLVMPRSTQLSVRARSLHMATTNRLSIRHDLSLVAFKMLVSSPSLLRALPENSRRRRQTTRAHGEYAILYLLFQTLTSFSGARCGRSTFDIDCFRAGHFHWCRTHSRPILSSWDNCGRDYSGCVKVVWGKTVLGSFIGCQLTQHRASP